MVNGDGGSPAGLTIRPVSAVDLGTVAAIYNHYVVNSVCTFATEPEGPAYWETWLSEHVAPYAARAAVREREVVGWGSLSAWNPRCGYRFTAEDSVYVRPECQGEGIGRALLGALIASGREHGHRNLIAQIADHQAASEALHRSFGFEPIGCLAGVGWKFDRWIDVTLWQLKLE